jgi:RNA-binding protein YlmH
VNYDVHTHFHPDERIFVDKAIDWVEQAAYQHKLKRTDFLDPRQAYILSTLVNRNGDVHIRLDGGYKDAERKRAVIAPDYRPLEDEEMRISVLSLSSPDNKLDELDHGDFMGAILGLGIKRDKIGDIFVIPGGCHCLAASEVADFLRLHINQVHRVRVHSEVLTTDALKTMPVQLEEHAFTVVSLRLDAIVGDVYRLSRAKAQIPIQAGRCRINWKPAGDPSTLLKEGDVVSLKGFGRFRVLEVEGITKKGRIRIRVGKYA